MAALAPVAAAVVLPTPTLTATASGPVSLGGTVHDSAALSGGSGTLTGHMTFQIFAPTDTTCSVPLTPAIPNVPVNGTLFGQDGFNRTSATTWGTADVGGAWSNTGVESATAFSVSPAGFGMQTTTSAGDTAVAGLAGTIRDVDTKVRVKFDSGTGVGSLAENRARILVRSNVASDTRQDDYELALSQPAGKSSLEAWIAKRELGPGHDVPLGSDTSTGLTQDASAFYWIRGQVSGTTSVLLRLKVWKDGTAEPATWNVTTTDSSPAAALQGAGHVDLSSYGNANLPLTVHFTDFQASSLDTYTSAGFTPSAAGTYHWIAAYSGDSNNGSVATACLAAGQDSVITGSVSAGSTYHAITPARVLDSRSGNGLSGTFKSRVARTFQVTGRGGVPSGATAVTGNLTVTQQTSAGYLFIGPVATNNPSSSTLNFPKGDTRANGVTVALGAGGRLSITFVGTSSATAQAIFDVTGYFTP
jgi:hypothetical protein